MSVSQGFFLFCYLGMMVTGVDQLRESSGRLWGVFILAIVGFALASVMLVRTIPYDLGAVIPETTVAIAFSEFSIVFGVRLLKIL